MICAVVKFEMRFLDCCSRGSIDTPKAGWASLVTGRSTRAAFCLRRTVLPSPHQFRSRPTAADIDPG
jgi:hypothetical protein